DVPMSPVDKATGEPLYPTMTATGTLFGPGGVPRVEDISQGDTGDCYFLSSLGTIVSRMGSNGGSNVISLASPENPDGMFIANGDGTYTVRFHVKAQTGPRAGTWVPDYVTVNDEFLVYPNAGTPEWLFANAYGVFSNPSNVLWVAYAEKAFVQFAGALGGSFANDYEAINGAFDANVTMMAITGRDGYVSSHNLATTSFEQIVSAYDRGVGAVFGTLATAPPVDTAADVPLVTNHDYMMVGYDRDARTIRLRNPWGDALDSAGYTGVRGTYDAVTATATEPGFTSLFVSATIGFLRTNFDAWYHV
ncbi:MAG: C2 family cysteine protease, partial [Planctomycetia bacterium]